MMTPFGSAGSEKVTEREVSDTAVTTGALSSAGTVGVERYIK